MPTLPARTPPPGCAGCGVPATARINLGTGPIDVCTECATTLLDLANGGKSAVRAVLEDMGFAINADGTGWSRGPGRGKSGG